MSGSPRAVEYSGRKSAVQIPMPFPLNGKEQGRGNRAADCLKQGQLHLRQIVESVIERVLQGGQKRRVRNLRDKRLCQIVRSADQQRLTDVPNGGINEIARQPG